MKTPRQLLEDAREEVFTNEDEQTDQLVFTPGLTDDEVAEFEGRLGHVLPADIAELVRFTSSIKLFEREVGFTEPFVWPFLNPLFPNAISLSSFVALDDWFIEVNPQSGAWGPAFYVSHDPAVFLYAFDSLAEFIAGWLADARSPFSSPLEVVRGGQSAVWFHQGDLVWANELTDCDDSALATFACQLLPDYLVADLRPRIPGRGLPWGWSSEILRHNDELLFAVRPGILRRLLRRLWR